MNPHIRSMIVAGATALCFTVQANEPSSAASSGPPNAASAAGAATAAPMPTVRMEDPPPPGVATLVRTHGAAITVRHYAGQDDPPEATLKVAEAFAALLHARGIDAWPASDVPEVRRASAAAIEIDPSFYVYTQKFNAQRVRLPVYVAAQLRSTVGQPNAKADASVKASEPAVDVLRVAAGTLGIVSGLLSPSHGAYMLATGSRVSNTLNEKTNELFGAGPAPVRLFGSDLDRYRRGEQEAKVVVRVRAGGQSWRTTAVAAAPGDMPPFAIDQLTASAWQAAVDTLSAVTTESRP